VCLTPEITQNERRTVFSRKLVQLLIERESHTVAIRGKRSRGNFDLVDRDLAFTAPECVGSGAGCNPVSHTVKPVGQEPSISDRASLAHKNEKRGLEGVFDVPRVPQEPAAKAQHHRAMLIDERPKGRLVSAGEVTLQKLAVAKSRERPLSVQSVNLLKHDSAIGARHP
jgi:hypothetical protein